MLAATALTAGVPARAAAIEPIAILPEALHEISLGGYVSSVALGPEGGVWYTGGDAELQRVTQSGFPTGDFTVKWGEHLGYPEDEYVSLSDLTAGSDGAMWFVDAGFEPTDLDLLGRITTTGKTSEFSVGASYGNIGGLTAGPGAAIWLTVTKAEAAG
jgi:virginiamycin B lyase